MNETKCQGWKKCILLKGGGVITRGLKQVQLCVISEVHDIEQLSPHRLQYNLQAIFLNGMHAKFLNSFISL